MALCANHIASAVAELPDYIALHRNISAAASEGQMSAPSTGIHLSDGSIWRGFYPHWDTLTRDEKDKVFNERKKMRNERKKGGGGGTGKGKGKGGGSDGDKTGKWKTEITQLQSALKKRNRKIASLKKGGEDDGSESASDGNDDAGNAFGGKRGKRAEKNKE